MRSSLVVLVAVAGCKYLDQPKKVAELQRRLDEIADKVSDMAGEPVGQVKSEKAAKEEADRHAAAGKKGKDRKAARDDDRAPDVRGGRSGRDDREDRDARDARDGDGQDGKDARDARGARDDEGKPGRADKVARDDEGARRRRDRDGGDEAAARDDRGDRDRAAPEPIALTPPADVPWSYDGATGPDAWASLDDAFGACGTGQAQSPIDILPRRSDAPEEIVVYRPVTGTIVDDGHGLSLEVSGAAFIVIDGTRFDLVSMRVHTPGEHTIAGDTFPMELQLVHRSKAGAVAIVAVLFDEGEPSAALAPLWKAAPRGRGSAKLKKPFDIEALLPKDRHAYRYEGSLTSPPCSEGVIWEVMRRPRTEDARVIAGLRHRFGANARPVQDAGDREVR